MNLSKLIQFSVTLGILAASGGKLPWILHKVRIAQLIVLKNSQAQNWGSPFLLQTSK